MIIVLRTFIRHERPEAITPSCTGERVYIPADPHSARRGCNELTKQGTHGRVRYVERSYLLSKIAGNISCETSLLWVQHGFNAHR
jgi:hypothetical protein